MSIAGGFCYRIGKEVWPAEPNPSISESWTQEATEPCLTSFSVSLFFFFFFFRSLPVFYIFVSRLHAGDFSRHLHIADMERIFKRGTKLTYPELEIRSRTN